MILEDADMRFDKKSKKYYLTEIYVANELEDLKNIVLDEYDLNPTSSVGKTIKRASKMIFDFIKHNSANYLSALYFLTHNEEAFEELKESILYQLEYLLQVGDTANAVDMERKTRVQVPAIDNLKQLNVFGVQYYDLPEFKEW